MSKLSERRREIREMTAGEAQAKLKELRRDLFNLRFQQQRGEVKNTRVFAQTRKDIARVLQHLKTLENE